MSFIGRFIMAFITPEIQALITKAVKEGGETAKLAEALTHIPHPLPHF